MMNHRNRTGIAGLTLIEVLVALGLWGLLTLMMSRGLDIISQSQVQQVERDRVQARLQTSLSQWQIDLNQMDVTSGLPNSLDWNGKVLRLVRYGSQPNTGHRQVVAWGLREGRWVRWQSAPLQHRQALHEAWNMALTALDTDAPQSAKTSADWVPTLSWQVFFFRNDSWSNALSSGGQGPATPDAIRLRLELAPQGPWFGVLQWDWVRPTWSVKRS